MDECFEHLNLVHSTQDAAAEEADGIGISACEARETGELPRNLITGSSMI